MNSHQCKIRFTLEKMRNYSWGFFQRCEVGTLVAGDVLSQVRGWGNSVQAATDSWRRDKGGLTSSPIQLALRTSTAQGIPKSMYNTIPLLLFPCVVIRTCLGSRPVPVVFFFHNIYHCL